ncbi:MAG: right-handed parallel beta-helix repeat-containing protein [Planctomycetota bacterium]
MSRVLSVLLSSLTLSLSAAALAGPLDPPAGPVEPTGKTLTEVEPRTPLTPDGATIVIDGPGSYYLTGDVDVADANGIRITSGGVTLDLNGFAVLGAAQLSPSGDRYGIELNVVDPGEGQAPIVIRNGIVRGFRDAGVYNDRSDITLIAEYLRVENGTAGGVYTLGDGRIERCTVVRGPAGGSFSRAIAVFGTGTIKECSVRYVPGIGIFLFSGLVSGCVVSDTGSDGMQIGDASNPTPPRIVLRVVDCVVERAGVRGYDADSPVTFEGCTASFCEQVGFWLDDDSTVNNCVSTRNGGDGYSADTGVTFNHWVAIGNGRVDGGNGFTASSKAVFIGCVADRNASDGFAVGSQGVVKGCSAAGNSIHGFDVGRSVNITDCNASDNASNGIDASIDCRVSGCTADGNTRSGLRIQNDSVADGNHATDNATGIEALTGSLVIRNTVAGNATDFDVQGTGLASVVSSPAALTNPLSNISF